MLELKSAIHLVWNQDTFFITQDIWPIQQK